ncbi:glycosyltransferase family 2 protein [uncultured Bacteroides sp.]|uniref:glycosyltransferase family 2 protein n=1 Tax=uncultured Bacteroides sp. TaxID=162156 RepID=UPI0025FC7F07|nr:glycosyltransferase family 2 protein [uncultured Bacteroides sp.]
MIKVLFLILNYKSYLDTIRVTDELLEAKRRDSKIIIVDNASPNESFQKISEAFSENDLVDVIQSRENGGYAKGNNYGLRYAKKYAPKYVCIINNDVHFSWDTVDALIEIYDKLDKPAVISPIQMLPDGKIASFPILKVPNFWYDIRLNSILFRIKKHVYKQNTRFENVQRVGIIPGAFLFTKYEIMEQIGFFNESTFLFCEERFLGKVVKDAGLNNYIILNLAYLHEHSKTINSEASLKMQRAMMHEGRVKFIKKYGKYPTLQILLIDIVRIIHEFELMIVNRLI